MAVAPPALVTLTDQFKARPDRPKSYVMGGIVGDAAHMSPPEGYHVSYNDLGGRCSSYGLSFTGDCAAGKAHPTYASAWDLSLSDADMITVTTRLINAAKANDPRVSMLWEIAGTTNGSNVHAYYLNSHTDDPTNKQQWASSHMHHVHLSFRRDHVTDLAKLAPLLDVICGVSLEDEVITDADITKIGDSFAARFLGGADGKPHQIFTLDKMAEHAERNPFIVQFPKAPKNPGAVYLVTGGALLWLQPADYTGEGAPTVSPIIDHADSAIYKLPILTGTPDPRIA